MYKISYDKGVYNNMINFSNYLKDYYFKLYTDTGIIDESIIINSYDESINTLQKQIFDNIESFCKTWLLWRKVSSDLKGIEKWDFYIKISSYHLKVNYEIDKKLSEVLIKNVKIWT